VERGEAVFHQVDRGAHLYVVLSGRIKLTHAESEGHDLMLAPGDQFGELALLDTRPRSATATAVEHSVLSGVDKETLSSWLTTCPGAMQAMLSVTARRLRSATQTANDVAWLDVTGRFARLISCLGDRFGTRGPRGVYIPQRAHPEELGQLVGAQRETVNKFVMTLVSRGLMSTKGLCCYPSSDAMCRRAGFMRPRRLQRVRHRQSSRSRP
jgi:CRP/FNR family cyclic AMP-dependent transcriptional regulator